MVDSGSDETNHKFPAHAMASTQPMTTLMPTTPKTEPLGLLPFSPQTVRDHFESSMWQGIISSSRLNYHNMDDG